MDKINAIKLISAQKEAIEQVKDFNISSKEFKIWYNETKVVIKNIFGINSNFYKEFDALSFYPGSCLVPIVNNQTYKPTTDELKKAYLKSLDHCDTMMNAMIKEIEISGDFEEKNTLTPIDIVIKICLNFHRAILQMKKRHDKRPSIDINDEYDVQDILHTFLKLHFDDIRPEEWTPSYAGSASRVDFLLKQEKIIIEVKKTRTKLRDREVGEQLIIDIDRYKSHPNCDTLICFVYDPDSLINNPVGLENDLNRKTDELNVITIISPK